MILRDCYPNISSLISLTVVILLPGLVGCSKNDRPAMAPVTGTVLLAGQPLEGASVRFMGPTGRPATGMTDADGRFTLKAFEEGDGSVLGENRVTVTKYGPPPFEPPTNPDGSFQFESEEQRIAFYNRPSLLPDRYNNPRMSGLLVNVTADGENDFTIELDGN